MLRRLSLSTSLNLLLLAALLLRGLLPLGYMPGSVAGEAGLVFCTSSGTGFSPLQEKADLSGVHASQECPFAAALGLAGLLAADLAPDFSGSVESPVRPLPLRADVFVTAPPQARGPPADLV